MRASAGRTGEDIDGLAKGIGRRWQDRRLGRCGGRGVRQIPWPPRGRSPGIRPGAHEGRAEKASGKGRVYRLVLPVVRGGYAEALTRRDEAGQSLVSPGFSAAAAPPNRGLKTTGHKPLCAQAPRGTFEDWAFAKQLRILYL